MKKALAVFLLFFVFPVFSKDPLKSIIDKHIIGNTLTFIAHLEEEINDIPGNGLTLTQQTKPGRRIDHALLNIAATKFDVVLLTKRRKLHERI